MHIVLWLEINMSISISLLICLFMQTICSTTANQLDSWFLKVFNTCTVHIIGSQRDFSKTSSAFGGTHPILVDSYIWPKQLGRFNINFIAKQNLSTLDAALTWLRPKFAVCLVQIQFWQSFAQTPKTYDSRPFETIFRAMVMLNENPVIIVFLFKSLVLNTVKFGRHVQRQCFTSYTLVAQKAPASIRTFCLTCKYLVDESRENLLFAEIQNVPEVFKYVFAHSAKLSGWPVVFSTAWLYPPHVTCGLITENMRTPSSACSVAILGALYNYTYTGYIPREAILNVIHAAHPIGKEAIKSEFIELLKLYGQRSIWFGYGCVYKYYKYVVFLKRERASDLAKMFQPFDIVSVYQFAASIVGVVVTLLLIFNLHGQSYLKMVGWKDSILSAVIYPLKTFLDQGDTSIIAICNKSAAGFIIIATYLFLCQVIGNEYEGTMFAIMTAFSIPNVPKTIRDLVNQTDIPYFTTTFHTLHQKAYSTLKDIVLPDLIATKQNTATQKNLVKLENDIRFILGSYTDMVSNITEKSYIKTDLGIRKVLNAFALVSTEQNMNEFVATVRKLTNYLIVTNNLDGLLVTRHPWLTRRNFFAKIFNIGLSYLVESGIYDKWDRDYDQVHIMQRLEQADKAAGLSYKSYYGFVVMANLAAHEQNLDGEPILLQNVRLVFLGTAALIAVGVAVLIAENIFMYVKQCRNKVLKFISKG